MAKLAAEILEDKLFALEQYDELLKARPDDAELWRGKANVIASLTDSIIEATTSLHYEPSPARTAQDAVLENLLFRIGRETTKDIVGRTLVYMKASGVTNIRKCINNAKFLEVGVLDEFFYALALASYERALQISPNDVELRQQAINFYWKFNRKEDAIKFCDEYVKKNPNDAIAWFLRGYALYWFSQDGEALQSLDEAMRHLASEDVRKLKSSNSLASEICSIKVITLERHEGALSALLFLHETISIKKLFPGKGYDATESYLLDGLGKSRGLIDNYELWYARDTALSMQELIKWRAHLRTQFSDNMSCADYVLETFSYKLYLSKGGKPDPKINEVIKTHQKKPHRIFYRSHLHKENGTRL